LCAETQENQIRIQLNFSREEEKLIPFEGQVFFGEEFESDVSDRNWRMPSEMRRKDYHHWKPGSLGCYIISIVLAHGYLMVQFNKI
jgi:hypothetical protein